MENICCALTTRNAALRAQLDLPLRRGACHDHPMSTNFEPSAFGAEWNALGRSERLRLRRLVRLGRSVDEPGLARLAPGYAQWQLQRPWMRVFWIWFVPGIVFVLGVAAQIHPVLVGATIALGAQAVWAYFNLRKAARGAT
jgi:hypothetical protein